jgi:hypothetical protein
MNGGKTYINNDDFEIDPYIKKGHQSDNKIQKPVYEEERKVHHDLPDLTRRLAAHNQEHSTNVSDNISNV